MADVAAAPSVLSEGTKTAVDPKPSTSKKSTSSVKKAGLTRRTSPPPEHPKYSVMIASAILTLKERGGSSRQAILKYIRSKYNLGPETAKINSRLKIALKAGVKSGHLKQSKGTGAAGSFRLGERKRATDRKSTLTKKARKPKSAAQIKKQKPKSTSKKPAKKPKSPAKKAAVKKTLKVKSPAKKSGAKKPKASAAKAKPKPKSPAKKAASSKPRKPAAAAKKAAKKY
ncbi:hypothetical protein BaRGS_00012309 [Batillaria attramentaria]|uniref:H15 domain-containing protein n=1 Tax=Batillaria attramentaria TaxID=370345 RepID=A0ABD0LAH2_9CAEN